MSRADLETFISKTVASAEKLLKARGELSTESRKLSNLLADDRAYSPGEIVSTTRSYIERFSDNQRSLIALLPDIDALAVAQGRLERIQSQEFGVSSYAVAQEQSSDLVTRTNNLSLEYRGLGGLFNRGEINRLSAARKKLEPLFELSDKAQEQETIARTVRSEAFSHQAAHTVIERAAAALLDSAGKLLSSSVEATRNSTERTPPPKLLESLQERFVSEVVVPHLETGLRCAFPRIGAAELHRKAVELGNLTLAAGSRRDDPALTAALKEYSYAVSGAVYAIQEMTKGGLAETIANQWNVAIKLSDAGWRNAVPEILSQFNTAANSLSGMPTALGTYGFFLPGLHDFDHKLAELRNRTASVAREVHEQLSPHVLNLLLADSSVTAILGPKSAASIRSLVCDHATRAAIATSPYADAGYGITEKLYLGREPRDVGRAILFSYYYRGHHGTCPLVYPSDTFRDEKPRPPPLRQYLTVLTDAEAQSAIGASIPGLSDLVQIGRNSRTSSALFVGRTEVSGFAAMAHERARAALEDLSVHFITEGSPEEAEAAVAVLGGIGKPLEPGTIAALLEGCRNETSASRMTAAVAKLAPDLLGKSSREEYAQLAKEFLRQIGGERDKPGVNAQEAELIRRVLERPLDTATVSAISRLTGAGQSELRVLNNHLVSLSGFEDIGLREVLRLADKTFCETLASTAALVSHPKFADAIQCLRPPESKASGYFRIDNNNLALMPLIVEQHTEIAASIARMRVLDPNFSYRAHPVGPVTSPELMQAAIDPINDLLRQRTHDLAAWYAEVASNHPEESKALTEVVWKAARATNATEEVLVALLSAEERSKAEAFRENVVALTGTLNSKTRNETVSIPRRIYQNKAVLSDLAAEPSRFADVAKNLESHLAALSTQIADKDGKTINHEVLFFYLRLPHEILGDIVAAKYSSAALSAIVFPTMSQAGEREITAKMFAEKISGSHPLVSDKYTVEYLTTQLQEHPQLQGKLLAAAVTNFAQISRDDSAHILAATTLINALGDEGFAQGLQAKIESRQITNAASLSQVALQDAAHLLSARYPESLVAEFPAEHAGRFIEVVSAFEKTLARFNRTELIAPFRVLATVELLGAEEKFRTGNKKFFAELDAKIAELFVVPAEHEAVRGYLREYHERGWLPRLMPSMNPADRETALELWNDPRHKLDHVLTEVTAEDRVNSAFTQLEALFQGGHLSAEFRAAHRLAETRNPAEELGRRWRAADAVEKALKKGTAAEASTADDEEMVRALIAELGAASRETALVRLGQIKSTTQNEQKRLKDWEDLRKFGISYSHKLGGYLERFSDSRRRLGQFVPELEELGFSFVDSFQVKVFRGELSVLKRELEKEGRTQGKSRRIRDEGRRMEMVAIVEELDRVVSDAEGYLQTVSGQLKKVLPRMEAKAVWAQGLAQDTSKGASDLLAAIREKDPSLAAHLNQTISEVTLEVERVSKVRQALVAYGDQTAMGDIKGLLSALSADSQAQPAVFTYQAEHTFSRMLHALKGQCLDYRSNRNSIGNSPYTVSFQDPFRQVVVGYDEQGTARFNALVYLAPVAKVSPSAKELPKEISSSADCCIVLDPPYVPDGSPLTRTKMDGYLDYAILKSAVTGLPVVIPSTVARQMAASSDKRQELQVLESEAANLRSRGLDAVVEHVDVGIITGPSGSTYCEIVGFDPYRTDAVIRTLAVVIRPKEIA
jgi:hypothetical protein